MTIPKDLQQSVNDFPFPEYQQWWAMGENFVRFMSESIVWEWRGVGGDDRALDAVSAACSRYVTLVYGRKGRAGLVDAFVGQDAAQPLQSGEFDALSYAFFHSAFELITATDGDAPRERRLFTKRVGRRFFGRVDEHLALALPDGLHDRSQFERLKAGIMRIGSFLLQEGYLRDHFDFTFEVDVRYRGRQIVQGEAQFLPRLHKEGLVYALYEMGYPVILPSAVHLYNTIGEAQHHSSRTIEELFERVGAEARETDDFDPGEHPSQRVVELWEIRKRR